MMNYKDTLNLPNTAFPMKANLSQKEPQQLESWSRMGLYEKLRSTAAGKKPFILHDGPPYANGHIHIGTALNKILKDFIVRSKQMAGHDAAYVPGWDCHGLPIEHNVEKELGDKKKQMTQAQIRKSCRAYAEKFIDIQKSEFKRLGVSGQWDQPYLTMNYEYEAIIAAECCKFAKSGELFRSKKPIHWCCSCNTALAEAEIEYKDETSYSIYVRFNLLDSLDDLLPELSGKEVYVVIWTTTPWTLPANRAVCLHPDFDYAAVDVGGGAVYILADALVENCMKTFGITDYRVLSRFKAEVLERKNCRHPLYDRTSMIILGRHVTLEAGTGCVHTAPGHGREDYEVGMAYGIEAFSPVDNDGRFTDEIGLFSGMSITEANPKIVETLKEKGLLLASGRIEHAYPHCWRCKKPVIFRATPQWFISMDKLALRKKSLEAIDTVEWIPKWGRERIYGMIENRPDWCVSRQRAWGVPIAVFYCESCGRIHTDSKAFETVFELFKEHGADVWFERDTHEFLPEGTVCAGCGKATLKKETDILDVWFDSGVSHAAVLERRPDLSWPADLYLEGSDQHRGWFHSSLLTAVGTRGRAPYKAVLTHGFVVDAEGRKMSKSIGNVVAPETVIKQYGAEILRLWVSASDYRDDIRISDNILKQLSDAYRRIRNTCRFLLGNLSDFRPEIDAIPYKELLEIDRFALHTLGALITRLTKAYDECEFHVVYHSLHNYCAVDLSAFYLDILKDRLYTSAAQSRDRRSAQTVLYAILDALVRLMAPVMAFTAEEIWQYMPQAPGKTESVHLALFPEALAAWNDAELAARWEQLLKVRGEVTKALEKARIEKTIGHPLDAEVRLFATDAWYDLLKSYEGELKSVFITSAASVSNSSPPLDAQKSAEAEGLFVAVNEASGEKCGRCWVHDPSVGTYGDHPEVCSRCHSALQEMAGSGQS
jgi:isoleucyl-tRNA synthetase